MNDYVRKIRTRRLRCRKNCMCRINCTAAQVQIHYDWITVIRCDGCRSVTTNDGNAKSSDRASTLECDQ